MSDKQIKKILEVGIFDDTKTVKLMDKFEGHGHDIIYEQLVLRNIACLNINGKYEHISLIVERSKDCRYVGNITFTELKKGETSALYRFLQVQISGEDVLEYKNSKEAFYFNTPYLLRAQNSRNRTGYGWGYGGTQYGETTAYVFVGAYIGYRMFGFSEEINKKLEEVDLSEHTIKNKSNNSNTKGLKVEIIENEAKEIELIEEELVIIDDGFEVIEDDFETTEDEFEEIIIEKSNIQDDETKPTWYFSGFTPETNLFVLALEQKIYLPPVIDECELLMLTDENVVGDSSLTLMEKSFMFFEILANKIGYSGTSVLSLDSVHKRKVLENVLSRNIDNVYIGEYGRNSISLHLVAEFMENQPEYSYRGYVELLIMKYSNRLNESVYELYGGYRDFGNNNIENKERQYWSNHARFLLDETKNGSYLQGFYELIMQR